MRITKDRKPFDVDALPDLEPGKGEVEVIQFLSPNGKRRRMLAFVGGELAELAMDMILSAEVLSIGEIAVYARFKDEPTEKEILEIAVNGPGKKSPAECLKKVIKRKAKER